MHTYNIEIFGEEPESYLHVQLAQPDLFEYTQTSLLALFDDVSASFSGTIPTVIVELNCYDVSRLINDDTYRTMFSRMCGPELFAAIREALSSGNCQAMLHTRELMAWQVIWQSLQDYICKRTFQLQHSAIAEDVYSPSAAAGVNSPVTTSSSNVVSLFGDR